MAELTQDVENNPEKYTYWFREILKNHRNLLADFFQ
jgi:hypothetical protein